MDDKNSFNFTARITSCLQTILELEPDLERLRLGSALIKEFKVLKSFLSKLDQINLEEEDVLRIETATENFLQELRTPLALVQPERHKPHTLQ